MADTELARAEKRYAQAKARLQGLKNREATRQRKMDTRRKVILGGALLDLAERDSGAAAMLDRLVRNLTRDQDRKAFVDWEGTSGDVSSGVSGEGSAGVSRDGPGGVAGGPSNGGIVRGVDGAPPGLSDSGSGAPPDGSARVTRNISGPAREDGSRDAEGRSHD